MVVSRAVYWQEYTSYIWIDCNRIDGSMADRQQKQLQKPETAINRRTLAHMPPTYDSYGSTKYETNRVQFHHK